MLKAKGFDKLKEERKKTTLNTNNQTLNMQLKSIKELKKKNSI